MRLGRPVVVWRVVEDNFWSTELNYITAFIVNARNALLAANSGTGRAPVIRRPLRRAPETIPPYSRRCAGECVCSQITTMINAEEIKDRSINLEITIWKTIETLIKRLLSQVSAKTDIAAEL